MNNTISQLIKSLSQKKGSQITFDELKTELLQSIEYTSTYKGKETKYTKQMYKIGIKEDDNVAIIFSNDMTRRALVDEAFLTKAKQLEDSCKSYIVDKTTLLPIASQYNNIMYNEDADEYLKQFDWNKQVVVQQCHEGTMILVFNHNDKWYISTRRCLNATNSTWIRNNSYGKMFNDAIENKFTFNDLDKSLCYHFILVHHKNKNIINYSSLYKKDNYAEVYHVMTTEKNTLNEVPSQINQIVRTVKTIKFTDLNSLNNKLKSSTGNKIQNEGYIIKVYDNKSFKILKKQTSQYRKIFEMKPNNSNFGQIMLELYQKDNLREYIKNTSGYNKGIIERVHGAMRTLSQEMNNIYHCTRNKKNPDLHNCLSKVIQGPFLHGLHKKWHSLNPHIKKPSQYKPIKQQQVNVEVDEAKEANVATEATEATEYSVKRKNTSINVHHTYEFLKNLEPYQLRGIFKFRKSIIDNVDDNIFDSVMDKENVNAKLLQDMMFGGGEELEEEFHDYE